MSLIIGAIVACRHAFVAGAVIDGVLRNRGTWRAEAHAPGRA